MYHDAYTLQMVDVPQVEDCNFVSGMVPFLLNLMLDVRIYAFYANTCSVHSL